MNIGVPRERRTMEHRVGLSPDGVGLLAQKKHTCYVEKDAGLGAGFSDYDYEQAGARIVYSAQEVFGRADLLLKIARPTDQELEWMLQDQVLAGFLHLAAARRNKVTTLIEKEITAIAYELIQDDDGALPVLAEMSAVAGKMVGQIGATFLQNNYGGKGVLMGGAPGVPPAEVVIIGAGVSGMAVAEAVVGLGASVYMLDKDLKRLHQVENRFGGRVVTMLSHPFNVAKVVRFADLMVGAVQVPGERAPIVVTREMVCTMRPRSVIIDLSIDQGGCVETSRPTTHASPTFVQEGVLHYCVPNMSSVVARTATHAFNNAAWPYIQSLVSLGLEKALEQNQPLARGVVTHQGKIANKPLKAQYESGAEQ